MKKRRKKEPTQGVEEHVRNLKFSDPQPSNLYYNFDLALANPRYSLELLQSNGQCP